MGIGDEDYHNYEGDLHAEVNETVMMEEEDGRMKNIARNRAARGTGRGSLRCSVHPIQPSARAAPRRPKVSRKSW